MRLTNEIIEIGTIILTPICFVYGWWFYIARLHAHRREWRSIVSLVALSLVSLAVVLWPVMLACSPRPDAFGPNYGVEYRYIEAWHRPILRTLLLASILSLFSKPRLIAPILISALGVAISWIGSTAL